MNSKGRVQEPGMVPMSNLHVSVGVGTLRHLHVGGVALKENKLILVQISKIKAHLVSGSDRRIC